jgi:hypothetical protein
MLSVVVAALLAVVSAKSPASFSDGNMLFDGCGESRQFIAGYVTGWLDKWNRDEYVARRGIAESIPDAKAMVNGAYFGSSVGVDFCVPADVRTKTISDMLCDFLASNAAVRDASGDDIMSAFVGLNFPCQRR